MVAYSFRPRFVEPILWGRKDQTIRLPRRGERGHARPGQGLQLFTGMRTKHCRLILRTTATGLHEVKLRFRPVVEVILDGARLAIAELDAFARRDGFVDFSDMERFWAETHKGDVFSGELIRWRPPACPVDIGADVMAEEAA